ncbi:MAG: polysaccharide biosynthesis tyrosine autokinase [Porphyrobacter sp.]|jgi:capsular exopolysaccharide synthesis family protein|nr:polysaccharide biosynthesis tyrosine autokinase [Porphyrobacter sp.]
MNDRALMQAPDPRGGGNWLDAYIADGQLVAQAPRQQLIDVAAIRGILFRQRWLVAAVIVVALIAGLVVTLLSTPVYKATASVVVDPVGMILTEEQAFESSITLRTANEKFLTQVEIIKSRKTASEVAERLNLGERYDLLGADVDERRPPNRTDQQWLQDKQQLAAAILQKNVTVDVPDDNFVLAINFSSKSPTLAAEIANAYAELFAESDTRTQVQENRYAKEYLQEQIELVRGRLEEAEIKANDYARNSGIVVQQSMGDTGVAGVTITTANLVSINQRVSEARAKRIEAEQRWRSIQNLPAGQLPEVQNNSVLQRLAGERTALETKLSELQQRYNDDFPQIVSIRDQIAILDQKIARTTAEIKAALRDEYTVARNQEQALAAELGSVKGETLAEQDKQVGFDVLEREVQALRDSLRSLLDRYNSVNTITNADTGKLTKLDSATVPVTPESPSLLRNMGLALVFGIAFAGGLAVLREVFDDRIRSLDDVETKFGLPLLGHTPFVEDRDLTMAGTNRFSALMEAYASIRSAIDFSMPRNHIVIQMTSSQASEGKTTTSVILAELFASLGRKTLLIDADLRRPSVAKLLEIEKPKAGTVEVLLGHTDLQSVVIKGIHENLEILPVGSISPNPTELLASNHMREFIEKCREEYSLILIDTSPVMGLADAPLISRMVDATIFVVEANKVQFGQARSAIRRVRSAGGNVLGVILTKYRSLEAGESYDYQYGYYQYGRD